VPWFLSRAEARVFSAGWCPAAEEYRPSALAGTVEQLVALAGIAEPTHAIIVLERPGAERASEEDRERLWQSFRVPIFEQIIGRAGHLLAAECEAHDGLHIESERLRVTGERIETLACACGRSSPRLMAADSVEVLRRAAAFAR
jgi:hypothetical protein